MDSRLYRWHMYDAHNFERTPGPSCDSRKHDHAKETCRRCDACSLRLVRGSQASSPYAALSYVWSMGKATWKTTKANVCAREDAFDVHILPHTLRDTVHIADSLGYRYLWIDCLCIVQDDADEWKDEAAKMASIYKHAAVAVVADSSSTSASGMFNTASLSPMNLTPHVRVTNELADGSQGTLSFVYSEDLYDDADFDQSPLSMRGWCSHERIACPRTLHYSRHQLLWECTHGPRAEDNIECYWDERHRIKGLVLFDDPAVQASTEQQQEAWYDIFVASDYSKRDLTYPNEKLNAIAGIAKLFYELRPGCYLAGHWEEGLMASLCWQAFRRQGKKHKATVYRAPSWSWASQECAVGFDIRHMTTFKAQAEILAVHTTTEHLYPFGEVTGGFVTLRAPMQRGHLGPGRYSNPWIYVEDRTHEEAAVDTEDAIEGEVIACFLGVSTPRDNMCQAHSLLLQGSGDVYKRMGAPKTTYEAIRRDNDTKIIHVMEELENKRQAPMEVFTIT